MQVLHLVSNVEFIPYFPPVYHLHTMILLPPLQMLGCETRGFSFTRALLGLPANELHLCGDPASVPLIKEILKVTGDNVKVSRFISITRQKSVI